MLTTAMKTGKERAGELQWSGRIVAILVIVGWL
jgi:hypothetical protein